MSIELKYLARLREELDSEGEMLSLSESTTVAELLALLAERGGKWQRLFAELQILVAVNQEMATPDTVIPADAEVALFPPVTGG